MISTKKHKKSGSTLRHFISLIDDGERERERGASKRQHTPGLQNVKLTYNIPSCLFFNVGLAHGSFFSLQTLLKIIEMYFLRLRNLNHTKIESCNASRLSQPTRTFLITRNSSEILFVDQPWWLQRTKSGRKQEAKSVETENCNNLSRAFMRANFTEITTSLHLHLCWLSFSCIYVNHFISQIPAWPAINCSEHTHNFGRQKQTRKSFQQIITLTLAPSGECFVSKKKLKYWSHHHVISSSVMIMLLKTNVKGKQSV